MGITANALSNPAHPDTLPMLRGCPGAFGPALATLLSTPSSFSDSAAADNILLWAQRRKEPEIFKAAIALAANASASRLQRLTALIILRKYLTGGAEDVSARQYPATIPDVEACVVTYGREPEKGDLSLPANAKATVFGVVSSIVNSDADDAVRHQAYCLYYITTPSTPGALSVPPPPETFVPAQHFRAEVLCGRRVRLQNVSRIPVSVQLLWGADAAGVLAETGLRDYTLEGRTPGASHFETIWQVPGTSTTMFLVRQVLTETGEPPYVVLQDITRLDTSACR